MGKVTYGMLVSLDNYIAGPEGGPGLPVPGAELHQHFNEVMKRTSLSVYGRRLYEVMRVWEDWDRRPEASAVEIEFAQAWRETPKLVFSTTLETVGPNARLLHGDLEATVRAAREGSGGDIDVGGTEVAAALSQAGLIDEYRLYLQPVVLGGGKRFFEPGHAMQLRLIGSEQLPDGVICLSYGRAG